MVELLFVLFIMALGIGLTLASFQGTKPLDEVEAATRQIAALVREAQNNSLAGKQQVDTATGSLVNICLNGLEWDGDTADSTATTFTLYSWRSGACDGVDRITRSETIKKVNIAGAAEDDSISFAAPGGKISTIGFFPSAAETAKIKIVSSVNNSIFGLVCVYSTGRIEEIIGTDVCP